VPAITTAGIYPGTSNVMAAHLVSLARKVSLQCFALHGEDANGQSTQGVSSHGPLAHLCSQVTVRNRKASSVGGEARPRELRRN